jgi:hypothetical protein
VSVIGTAACSACGTASLLMLAEDVAAEKVDNTSPLLDSKDKQYISQTIRTNQRIHLANIACFIVT